MVVFSIDYFIYYDDISINSSLAVGIKFNLHIQLLKRQITGNGNVTLETASAVVQSHDVQVLIRAIAQMSALRSHC